MKQNEVVVGGVYLVRIGSNVKLSRVRIDFTHPPSYGTFHRKTRWTGTNLETGREITGTAARLRRRVDAAPTEPKI